MEGDRQPLQMPVQIGPHRRLDPGQRPGHQPPPQPEQARLGETEQQQHPGERPQPAGSWSATGPSTIHFRTSGITSAMKEATSAAAAGARQYQRIGRAYGHSRSRERTAERLRGSSGASPLTPSSAAGCGRSAGSVAGSEVFGAR